MIRRAKQKGLRKDQLLDVSIDTVNLAMESLISKIKMDSLTKEQKEDLVEIWDSFVKINDSYYVNNRDV